MNRGCADGQKLKNFEGHNIILCHFLWQDIYVSDFKTPDLGRRVAAAHHRHARAYVTFRHDQTMYIECSFLSAFKTLFLINIFYGLQFYLDLEAGHLQMIWQPSSAT